MRPATALDTSDRPGARQRAPLSLLGGAEAAKWHETERYSSGVIVTASQNGCGRGRRELLRVPGLIRCRLTKCLATGALAPAVDVMCGLSSDIRI